MVLTSQFYRGIMMQLQGYEFTETARHQAGALKDANTVGERLEMLRKQHGNELTPEIVLDDAKNSNSPLHSHFEWSDTAAAHQWRLRQAGNLIRTVVAVYKEKDSSEPIQTRAYVHVRPIAADGTSAGLGTKGHYQNTVAALSVPNTRKQILDTAMAEMKAWKKRYGDLKELAAIVQAIDEVDVA